MARKKRNAGEINAGSMADIAFLLLIFFLITTTMNLPQVHEERLPQKSDVEFLLNEKNVLQIMANKNDKIVPDRVCLPSMSTGPDHKAPRRHRESPGGTRSGPEVGPRGFAAIHEILPYCSEGIPPVM